MIKGNRILPGVGLEIAETIDHLTIARDAAASALERGDDKEYGQASMAADEHASKLKALLDRVEAAPTSYHGIKLCAPS